MAAILASVQRMLLGVLNLFARVPMCTPLLSMSFQRFCWWRTWSWSPGASASILRWINRGPAVQGQKAGQFLGLAQDSCF